MTVGSPTRKTEIFEATSCISPLKTGKSAGVIAEMLMYSLPDYAISDLKFQLSFPFCLVEI